MRPVTIHFSEIIHYITRDKIGFQAYDQPDVYETNELPEADQYSCDYESEQFNEEVSTYRYLIILSVQTCILQTLR